jgi:hypothetical protein
MTRVRLLAGASSVVLGLSVAPARADSAKQQCAAAFEAGQRSQMVGDLQQAIEEFESCAASSCSAVAQRECTRLLGAAQLAIPAVQFDLTFGTDLSKRPVMLSVDDGEPRTYDGEVLRVNPGRHRFVFECQGCATVTRLIAFAEQDSQRKEVAFSPACGDADGASASAVPRAEPREPPPRRPPGSSTSAAAASSKSARASAAPRLSSVAEGSRPSDTLIVGTAAALAIAGGLGFVGFGLEARSGERGLLECAPYCSGASIAEVKRNYVLANVSLGTGVLALGGATVWWLGLRRSSPTPSANAKSRSQWSVELGAISKLARTF